MRESSEGNSGSATTDRHPRFGRKSTAEQVSEGADLSGQHAVVTGASTGIGLETARVLALRGASVTMACRNLEKTEAARRQVVDESGGRIAAEALEILHLDLASLASVRSFADEFLAREYPIHLLINNAGVMLPDRRETSDGFEAHFGTNHLGHFLLTNLLLDRILESAPARIVNVSSEAMQFASLTPRLSDLNWEERRFSGWRSYGDSKLMNLMFTNELNRRFSGAGVTSIALHPGIVMTELARDQTPWMHLVGIVARPFSKAVDRGAATTLYAALHADPARPGENYLADCAPSRTAKLAGNREVEAKLWSLSEERTGL
ncbi:MAG: SDR family oxidoreductase [Deltaproteobacteria bacterium]|nr:SDR family oxidoreductase [Deltaproteobacteria bacterium]MBW2421914.1 SDR family oxidoreductase [Deltaproteobacteria bacterium]